MKIFQDNQEDELLVLPVKVELPKKRGISSKILECNLENSESLGFSFKKFVKEKSCVEKIQEKNLERHIQKKGGGLVKEEFVIPEKYKPDNSRIVEGTEKSLWLAGLVEVPLSIDHKIDNIEATEAAKRKFFAKEEEFKSRFHHLHEDEIETFNQKMTQAKNLEKEIERLERNLILRGKRYKVDKEERVKNNRKLENSWKD
jgi:hypothetical protein